MPKVYVAIFIGLAAVWDDVAHRRISNWIPMAAFLSGIFLQCRENGWRGGFVGLLGAVTGAAVFLLFYLLGGMGGGDIKLMAGFGAMLGANGILEASLWTAACGGIMAAGLILFRTLRRSGSVNQPAEMAQGTGSRSAAADSIPYAPAIAAGVWLSLVAKT